MLNTVSPIPLYHQLAEKLRQEIAQGKIVDGERCFSDRELMRRYKLSLLTVRHAIDQLVEEGLVVRRRGQGTFLTARGKRLHLRHNQQKQQAILFAGWTLASLSAWQAMYFRDIYEGMEREAMAFSLRVVAGDAADIVSAQVVGAIMLQCNEMEEKIRELSAKGLKIIAVNSPVEGVPSVYPDHFAGGRLAVEHLLSLGHRRFVHLNSGETTCHWEAVRAAFCETLRVAGLEPLANAVIDCSMGGGTVEAGYEAMRRAWERSLRPTAVVAGNDLMAIGALRFLQERDVAVPAEVSVIGFDNIAAAEICHPALTTIAVDRTALGRRAVQMLLDPAVRPGEGLCHEAMPVSLVERGSTAPSRG